ncbi:MAG: hypothetical protein AAGJ40_18605 [Planctomycetota bacterium]
MTVDFEGAANPYRSQSLSSTGATDDCDIVLPVGMERGLTSHVQILGVLMVVQGVSDVLMAIAIGFYATFLPSVLFETQSAPAGGGTPTPAMPSNVEFWMLVVGVVLAVLIAGIGVMTVWMGLDLTRFRSRPLAIGMLWAGMLTLPTCYCFPTSFILAGYGMVVLMNRSVVLAFELRRRNHSVAAIQEAFVSLP